MLSPATRTMRVQSPVLLAGLELDGDPSEGSFRLWAD